MLRIVNDTQISGVLNMLTHFAPVLIGQTIILKLPTPYDVLNIEKTIL